MFGRFGWRGVIAAVLCAGCVRDPAPAVARTAPDAPRAGAGVNAGGGGGSGGGTANGNHDRAQAAGNGVRVLPAPPGDLPTVMRQLVEAQRREHRDVLVYVGATWCEPCQHFHHAVDAHALDRDFPNLTLVEFDLDRDGERLAGAGYVSRMIPLFAVPAADGRSTGRHMEGSIHGPEAVGEIVPRLRALIGG